MVDPLISLAFSVQGSKGIYALLLGSGLSTAAGIRTGWDVTLDLVPKVASSSGEDCGGDPLGWYKNKYGVDADYSDLLDDLAKTPADRANLLSAYFEPSTKDLESGGKAPTAAHKSIARLVAKGYVRVIVTTNFDRLLERALDTEGISPTIVSTPDGARGALPLAHARCTVIKVNGDYRDTRIKNTKGELEAYDKEIDLLLDRVFDEYGLVVCGWSATWDVALCNAVVRAANRRFTTFWARRKTISDEARRLVVNRQAVELEIDSADSFFTEIETKLDAIDRYSQPHPASAKVAIASLKKFIAEDRYRIELHDLVASETERLFKTFSPLPTDLASLATINQVFERMKLYENASEIATALLSHGTFWGQPEHRQLWCNSIARMTQLKQRNGHLISLCAYPACLLTYAAALACIAAGQYETLRTICCDTIVSDDGQRQPLLRVASPPSVLDPTIAKQLPGCGRPHTPLNDRLFVVLREPLREYLPDDSSYEQAFDRFEYLISLIEWARHGWVRAGRFGWSRMIQNTTVMERLSSEAESEGDKWAVVSSGLFPSTAKFQQVAAAYREQVLAHLHWY